VGHQNRAPMPSDPRASILIVDDEAAQMQALCDSLGATGYRASGFTDPEAALSALADQRFEVLLSDLNMPGLDGITLLREALKIDPDVIGIIMTGQATIDTAIGAMKTGAFDYILKPFRLSAILPVLTRALSVRELRLQNSELERSIKARSAELEAANKQLDAFVHSVSHDLHAPLRGVAGIAKILQEDFGERLGAQGRRLIEGICAGCERMAQLIDDMLAFSRLGRQPLTTQPVPMNELVSEVLLELQPAHVARDIQFSIGELGTTQADPALLRQVLVNLLSNAIKFTGKTEHASVEVGALPDSAGQDRTYFVKDNGAGFDMRHAEKLFGVFERLHRREEFEGTGVGLAIVQQIVERHGGRVWAEGLVGRGATFYFTLPIPGPGSAAQGNTGVPSV
jgi:two-component system sensor histidine kinase/response regulator